MSDEQSTPDRGVTGAGGAIRPGNSHDGAGSPTDAWRVAPAAAPFAGDGEHGPPDPAASAAEQDPATDDTAASATAEATSKKRRSFWRELPILVLVALVIALLIKAFVVQAFFIPSSSMENTLLIGDKVLVNKLVYHFRKVEPGDIVVFNGAGSWDPIPPPAKPSSDPLVRAYDATLRPLFSSIAGLFGTAPGQTDYIKRVIGVPGDRVACCTHGLLTVNGVPLHEQSYLYPGAEPSQTHFSVTVPPGRLWVMGDNRAISDDSRLHMSDPGHGTIPESAVVGRAFLIVWPPSRWRVLSIPATFDQPGIDSPARAASGVFRTAAGPTRPAGRPADSAVPEATLAALDRGAPVVATPSYLPLAAGFATAVPLTWLQRRLRLRGRRRRRPGHR